MSNKTVSVIIPLYNSEEFVSDIVNAVKKQTFTDWELILVDDHSSDDTYNIAESLIDDNKIRLLKSDHKGVSSARNTGIRVSCGEYLSFIDADDDIDSEYLASLVRNIKTSNADMAFQGYFEVDNNETKEIRFPWVGITTHEQIIEKVIPTLVYPIGNEICPMMPVWRTIFSKKFLNQSGYCFDEGISNSEDFQLFLQLLFKCHRIYGSNETHYFYKRRNGSAMNSYIRDNLKKEFYVHDLFLRTLKENHFYDSVQKRYESNRMELYSHAISNVARSSKNNSFKLNEIKELRKAFLNDNLFNYSIRGLYVPLNVKVAMYLLKVNMLRTLLTIYSFKEKRRLNNLV